MKKPYEYLPIPGFCDLRDETVSEIDCRRCFFSSLQLRDDVRDEKGNAFRETCVERHIEAPRLRVEREAQVVRLRPMLDRMDAGGWQGIVRNVLGAALAHPDEETAKNLLRQIEAHAEHAATPEEPPDPGDGRNREPVPICRLCGAEGDYDDSVCKCGGIVG